MLAADTLARAEHPRCLAMQRHHLLKLLPRPRKARVVSCHSVLVRLLHEAGTYVDTVDHKLLVKDWTTEIAGIVGREIFKRWAEDPTGPIHACFHRIWSATRLTQSRTVSGALAHLAKTPCQSRTAPAPGPSKLQRDPSTTAKVRAAPSYACGSNRPRRQSTRCLLLHGCSFLSTM